MRKNENSTVRLWGFCICFFLLFLKLSCYQNVIFSISKFTNTFMLEGGKELDREKKVPTPQVLSSLARNSTFIAYTSFFLPTYHMELLVFSKIHYRFHFGGIFVRSSHYIESPSSHPFFIWLNPTHSS